MNAGSSTKLESSEQSTATRSLHAHSHSNFGSGGSAADIKTAFRLANGQDRFQQKELMIWGLLPLAIKVSAQDTGGALLLFEHRDMVRGGPPRHIHFAQDEWFYVLKGEFEFEIGEERHRLKAGETLFAPRNIPHGWAHVGTQPGTLLTMVSPAGTFEEFILETTKHATLPPQEDIEQAFIAHGMKVVGPPLLA